MVDVNKTLLQEGVTPFLASISYAPIKSAQFMYPWHIETKPSSPRPHGNTTKPPYSSIQLNKIFTTLIIISLKKGATKKRRKFIIHFVNNEHFIKHKYNIYDGCYSYSWMEECRLKDPCGVILYTQKS